MGRGPRKKPARLAEKLRDIRTRQLLSQDEIVVRMGLSGEIDRTDISAFERGKREPPLPILASYGTLAGVYVEVLIKDDLDLPDKLPAFPKSHGIPLIRESQHKTVPNQKPPGRPRRPKA